MSAYYYLPPSTPMSRASSLSTASALVPVGAGITRVLLHFGFMEIPNVMEALKLACLEPELVASILRTSRIISGG